MADLAIARRTPGFSGVRVCLARGLRRPAEDIIPSLASNTTRMNFPGEWQAIPRKRRAVLMIPPEISRRCLAGRERLFRAGSSGGRRRRQKHPGILRRRIRMRFPGKLFFINHAVASLATGDQGGKQRDSQKQGDWAEHNGKTFVSQHPNGRPTLSASE